MRLLAAALICAVFQVSMLGSAVAQNADGADAPQGEGQQVITGAPILVLSMDRILRESGAAISIQRQVDAIRTSVREDLATREEALRREEVELTKLRETLEPASFNERVAAFKEKVRELKREGNATGGQLQAAVYAANSKLKEALQPILAQIMGERRALVMLDEKDVVISATALDVTQEAIERLDATTPRIEVRMPAGVDE